MASGSYTSPSEVFKSGLEALRAEERDLDQWLADEVVPALDEVEANPSLGGSIDVAFAEISEQHAFRIKSCA